MKKLFFAALIHTLSIAASAQGHVDGRVVDAVSGESLPYAYVRLAVSRAAAVTNAYGFFALAAPDSPDTLCVSFVGYEPLRIPVAAKSASDVRLALRPAVNSLSEVTVKARGAYEAELKSPAMSHHHLSGSQIKRTVMMFGEPDALKTLQLMPGVNATADGSNNLSIRGGSHDQNLILLDEAVVFNPSHAMGLVSAFNPDAVHDVDLYKGAIPARYGGRLSAVVDMRMKEGDANGFHVSGGLGTMCSRLVVEGPIKKDTASFIVSARRGYAKLLTLGRDLFETSSYDCPDKDNATFGDYSVKLNWRLPNGDRLFASAYASDDLFHFFAVQAGTETKWSNKTATLRWNHAFANNIFANTTVAASSYDYSQEQKGDTRDCKWTADMAEIDAKIDVDHYASVGHFQYGAGVEAHRYKPGNISPTTAGSAVKEVSLGKKRLALAFLYAELTHSFVDRFRLSAGLRMSVAPMLGPATVFSYADRERDIVTDTTTYSSSEIVKSNMGLEPRLGLSFNIADWVTAKASYARTKQYQHLLTNSALSLPTDIWAPADSYAKPQTSNAIAIGLHTRFARTAIEASVEAYMKWTDDLVDFKDGADLKMNPHYETQLLSGRGYARGVEFMLRRDAARYAFSLAYTLSKAERRIDGVNGGRWYYERFDQRHNLALSATYRPSAIVDLSAVFRYHTGGRTTLPDGYFFFAQATFGTYTERNGYVMDDFHRLDVSADFHLREHQRWSHSLLFAVANVYGRKNPYSMYTKGDFWDRGKVNLYKLHLYRWLPSLTYVFRLK